MHNPLHGYTVRLSKHAQKAFGRLSNQMQERVLEKLTQLTESSHHLDVKKMEGFKNFIGFDVVIIESFMNHKQRSLLFM
jgi:mRNA-degrading endonuclease RelE of RelBE toxin-antitoxin system